MFYANSILSKKGPLGVIWIAAHLDRRLKRQQINETSITNSVDSIINPEAPLALRLSGQLMLGVVRIYSRKVGYLYQDTNETLIKIQQAFRDHASSKHTPADALTVPTAAITLHDTLDDYELLLSAGPASFDVQLDPLADGPLASHRESLSMSIIEDLSGALGSQAGMEDELFEVAGDELERRISMAMEVEQLRRDSSRRPSALFEGIVGRPSSPGAAMSGPPSVVGGMLHADGSVGPTPGSGYASKQVAGGDDALPDFGVDMLPDMGDMMMGNAAEDMHPATSAADAPHPPSHDDATHTMATSTLRAAHATNANRKRKLVVDVVDGRPAVDLDGRHMRALMVDRAPLLTKRGWGARGGQQHTNNKAYGPQSLLVELVGGNTAMCDPRSSSGDHNGDAGTQANRRLLERPGMLGAAAPVLLALFDGMVQLPGVHPTRKNVRRTHDDEDNNAPPSSKRRRSGDLIMAAELPIAASPDAAHPQVMSPMMHAMDNDAPWMGADQPISPWVDDAEDGVAADAAAAAPPLPTGPHTASKHTPAAQQQLDNNNNEGWTGVSTGGSLLHTIHRTDGGAADANADFTARSRIVLEDLKQRVAHQDPQDNMVSLCVLTEGQSRLEAARVFFEALVLHSKGMVQLEQQVAYGDVAIIVTP